MTGLDRDTSKSPDRTGVCCTGRCAPSQCETITGPSFSSLNKPDQERTPAYRDSSGSESPSGCLLCYFFRRLGGAIWGIPVGNRAGSRNRCRTSGASAANSRTARGSPRHARWRNRPRAPSRRSRRPRRGACGTWSNGSERFASPLPSPGSAPCRTDTPPPGRCHSSAYASNWGRPSAISNQGAFEPTKI